jgi:hypothetical protein
VLGNLIENGGINKAVIDERFLNVGPKDGHVLFPIGGSLLFCRQASL